MPGKRWSVPFVTETTDIWEVEAPNERSAVMEATTLRSRYLFDKEHGNEVSKADAPTHSHMTKFVLGTVRPTVLDTSKIAGSKEPA
jgi:hypothetical protein